ncbi:MAG: L-threonylcarbamoyladenylate synthase [Alphaproteobacteria bacterium]
MIAPSKQQIKQAVDLLESGEVVAFPTETVYGLGADASNEKAVAKIYAIKGRPSFNPLIFHVKDLESAQKIGHFSETALKLAHAFWPGPLTLVVQKAQDAQVSMLATAGLETIAIRVSSHPVFQEILQDFGKPIVAPSANPSGFLSSTNASHVVRNLGKKVSLILDGGPCAKGLESTIIDATPEHPTVLRYGALPVIEIEQFLQHSVRKKDQVDAIKAPGQLKNHYAPRLPLRMNATECLPGEIFLGFGPIAYSPWNLSDSGNLIEAASRFFAYLHMLDASDLYIGIAVAPIPEQGLGLAINDRLRRAAAPKEL